MKNGVHLIALGCLFFGATYTGAHEKRLHFKKKISSTQAIAAKKARVGATQDDYITVWIHGVNLFSPNRYNTGLWPAYTFVENKGLFNIGRNLVESDPQRFPAENVFIYSWAGIFDVKESERAAACLYGALLNTIKEYTAQNKSKPKLRLITFSYGGNIALNLPKFKDPNNKLVIDELVILGWPVQRPLAKMAHDSMFKKVFNLYSPTDFVQILDPQGFCHGHGVGPLFSSRRLKRSPNVLQSKIHINGSGVGHFGLADRQFLSMFPLLLDELDDWFCYAQEHNLGLKRTRYMLTVYPDKKMAHKHK